jgi:hypothetical protein
MVIHDALPAPSLSEIHCGKAMALALPGISGNDAAITIVSEKSYANSIRGWGRKIKRHL